MAGVPSLRGRLLPLVLHRHVQLACRFTSTTPGSVERKHPDIDLTFENTKEAFKSKTTWQLLRGLLVLRLCTIDTLVKHNHALMKRARQVLGAKLFSVAMKSTFYGHFVAGNTQDEIKPVISKMRQYGVKSILDYSVEKDVEDTSAETVIQDEQLEPVPEEQLKPVEIEKQTEVEDMSKQFSGYTELWDRREGVKSARTFFYSGEPECDNNAKIFLESVDAVADATEGTGFVAIKLTALGRPLFLIKLSEVLARSQQFYRALNGCTWETMLQQRMSRTDFLSKLKELGIKTESRAVKDWFDKLDFDDDGFVDMYEWSRLLDSSFKLGDLFRTLNLRTGQMEPLIDSLTDMEEAQFANMMRRVTSIVEHAQKRGVRVMIDAEQTYFQPAISRLVLEMQRTYNHSEPVVFNTYQAYLRHALDNVRLDMHLAKREGFHFACKLVRGAYMEQERHRAELIGYRDPINPDFEATSKMYDDVFCHVLDEVKNRKPGEVCVMCATHNETSIRNAVQEMRTRDIHPDDKVVCFGQLYGMCDQVSFSLGQAGYSVYKYVPYGPVDEVLPYLSRRAQENSGIIKKAQKERRLMAAEVRRRLIPGM